MTSTFVGEQNRGGEREGGERESGKGGNWLERGERGGTEGNREEPGRTATNWGNGVAWGKRGLEGERRLTGRTRAGDGNRGTGTGGAERRLAGGWQGGWGLAGGKRDREGQGWHRGGWSGG